MATSDGGGEEELIQLAELSKTLKEGERLLAPTRRPDGSLRKPIRIRAGYVPQDEVAIYQSKGALWKKEMASQEVPPGYDPVLDSKPKTKSVKRNERKKEKRLQQAALDKGKKLEPVFDGEIKKEEVPGSFEVVTSQMNGLAISANHSLVSPPTDSTKALNSGGPVPDIDKRIRALKKKIRLVEAQQQKNQAHDMKSAEQLDKMTKLEGWREELKLLENKNGAELGI